MISSDGWMINDGGKYCPPPLTDFNGAAEIVSDQPIVAIGRPHIGLEIMAYNGANAGAGFGLLVGLPSFLLMIGISALEILVAGIQAYVFALLSSLYISDAENLH